MIDKLESLAESLWWLVPMWVATFVIGLVLMRWLILRIPADYFVRPPQVGPDSGTQYLLWLLKNAGGVLIFLAGIVMLFTPGPGILGMVLGLSLIDFPGKQKFEAKLLCQPRVLHAANHFRAKHGIQPLQSPRECVAG